MSGSIHEKLNRVRKPRVHITYEVETEGTEILRELPFIVGVMGDFSGDPTAPLKPMADRKFIQVDRDNFDDVMAAMTPGVKTRVDNTLAADGTQMSVDLKFNKMEDFEPAKVAAQVPALAALMETRDKLRDLMSKADRSEELESLLEQVLRSDDRLERAVGRTRSRARRRAEPMSDTAKASAAWRRSHDGRRAGAAGLRSSANTKQTEPDRAQDLVKTLVEQALSGTVTFDKNLTRTFERAIAAIDRKLSTQLNAIMHDPKFLKLEGTWRGLNYLVMNRKPGRRSRSAC